jgi:large subunit ribosomal protein L9
MKVIMLQDVENVGDKNDVRNVAAGHARNFLIPRGLAVTADESALKQLENKLKFEKRRQESIEQKLVQMADAVEGSSVVIKAHAGEDGKLYGSVTAKQVAEALTERLKIEFDKRRVKLDAPIKQIGEYKVKVTLGPNKRAEIVLNVVSDVVFEKTAETEKPAAEEKKAGKPETEEKAEAPEPAAQEVDSESKAEAD